MFHPIPEAIRVQNAINHRHTLQPIIDRALADPRIDALVVPVGKGLLLCRRA